MHPTDAGLKTAQHAAAVAKKAARARAEQIEAVLNSPPAQQQAPLAQSPPTVTLQEAAAFGRGLAGHSWVPILNGVPAVDRLAATDGRRDSLGT